MTYSATFTGTNEGSYVDNISNLSFSASGNGGGYSTPSGTATVSANAQVGFHDYNSNFSFNGYHVGLSNVPMEMSIQNGALYNEVINQTSNNLWVTEQNTGTALNPYSSTGVSVNFGLADPYSQTESVTDFGQPNASPGLSSLSAYQLTDLGPSNTPAFQDNLVFNEWQNASATYNINLNNVLPANPTGYTFQNATVTLTFDGGSQTQALASATTYSGDNGCGNGNCNDVYYYTTTNNYSDPLDTVITSIGSQIMATANDSASYYQSSVNVGSTTVLNGGGHSVDEGSVCDSWFLGICVSSHEKFQDFPSYTTTTTYNNTSGYSGYFSEKFSLTPQQLAGLSAPDGNGILSLTNNVTSGQALLTTANISFDATAAPVPIPSAFWLFACGCGFLAFKQPRKNNLQQAGLNSA